MPEICLCSLCHVERPHSSKRLFPPAGPDTPRPFVDKMSNLRSLLVEMVGMKRVIFETEGSFVPAGPASTTRYTQIVVNDFIECSCCSLVGCGPRNGTLELTGKTDGPPRRKPTCVYLYFGSTRGVPGKKSRHTIHYPILTIDYQL